MVPLPKYTVTSIPVGITRLSQERAALAGS